MTVLLGADYAARNPWAANSPPCINGCSPEFVILVTGDGNTTLWHCTLCTTEFEQINQTYTGEAR